MPAQVTLISIPQVDWPAYLRAAIENSGRNPAAVLDSQQTFEPGPAGFLRTIGEFQNPNNGGQLPSEASLTRHLHFAFLIADEPDVILDMLSKSRLAVTRGRGCAIVSGTLDQWIEVIPENTTLECSESVRRIYDQIVMIFDLIGFIALWPNHQRIRHPDNTFTVQRRLT